MILDKICKVPVAGDLLWGAETVARSGVNILRTAKKRLSSKARSDSRRQLQWRNTALKTFLEETQKYDRESVLDSGKTTLIDGMFDNIGHWYRYSIVRSALGLNNSKEVVVTHRYSLGAVNSAVNTLGIGAQTSIRATAAEFLQSKRRAEKVYANLKSSGEIIDMDWPCEWPGCFVYDELQRKQKRVSLSLDDRRCKRDIVRLYSSFAAAERVLEGSDVGLIVLSHVYPFEHAALAQVAMRKGIPVLLMYASYGTLRAIRLRKNDDLYRYGNLPDLNELAAFDENKIAELQDCGRDYHAWRLDGKAPDLAAILSYRKPQSEIKRQTLCDRYGWPTDRPIVAVYTMCWFDTPHAQGMTRFQDFHDWFTVTVSAASDNPNVSWLLKPHPGEVWYGGQKLSDILPKNLPGHIRMLDFDVSNTDIISVVDSVISVHGTAGLEYSMDGKPALLAEPGWYGHFDVGMVAQSRDAYVQLLKQEWWSQIDLERSKRNAELVAGLCYGVPEWQVGFVANHDTEQDFAAPYLTELVRQYPNAWMKECDLFRSWFEEGPPTYHSYKMLNSVAYGLPDINAECMDKANRILGCT